MVERRAPQGTSGKSLSRSIQPQRDLLLGLTEQILSLRADVRAVVASAQRKLESQWPTYSDQILPALELWCKAVRAEKHAVFGCFNNAFHLEEKLSSVAAPEVTETFGFTNARSTLDSVFAENVSEKFLLCFANHELQCDFQNKTIVMPIVFFDRINAIIVVKCTELEVKDYSLVIAESETLLKSILSLVLDPQVFSELVVDTKKAI